MDLEPENIEKRRALRTRALDILKSGDRDQPEFSSLSDEDGSKLIHELQVHQIELELQNEELRASEQALMEVRDFFWDLYEFAPVGYLTLNSKGLVQEINLTACRMLGVDKASMINKPLSRLLYSEDAGLFHQKFHQVFLSDDRLSCEMRFEKTDREIMFALLECNSVINNKGERSMAKMIISDITRRKTLETLFEKQSKITETMYGLAVNVLAAKSVEHVASTALHEALKITGSKHGYAGYIDPQTGSLNCPTLTHEIWDQCDVQLKTFVFKNFTGLWGWGINNKTCVVSNSPSLDSRSTGTPKGHIPIHRVLCVPAMDGETLVGQISVANAECDYTQEDLTTLQQLTSIFSLGIQAKLAEEAKNKVIGDLEKALAEIKTLKGLIPICASCKKIRDDQGFWHAVEVYIRDRTDAQFSHGICPDCARKLYPDFFKD